MAITYDSIASVNLGSAQLTMTLSSIPAGYTDLRLVVFFRSDGSAGTNCIPTLRFNGDTATNYQSLYALAGGGSTSGGNLTTKTSLWTTGGSATAGSTYFYCMEADIMDYASTTRNKTAYTRLYMASNSGNMEATMAYGAWSSNAAINSITVGDPIFGNKFTAGSFAALYGILRA